MKRILYIFALLILLVSCGPKRMGCGARGICKTITIHSVHDSSDKTNEKA
ncbi:hypothetical protein [Flavobacterium sp. PL12]